MSAEKHFFTMREKKVQATLGTYREWWGLGQGTDYKPRLTLTLLQSTQLMPQLVPRGLSLTWPKIPMFQEMPENWILILKSLDFKMLAQNI